MIIRLPQNPKCEKNGVERPTIEIGREACLTLTWGCEETTACVTAFWLPVTSDKATPQLTQNFAVSGFRVPHFGQ